MQGNHIHFNLIKIYLKQQFFLNKRVPLCVSKRIKSFSNIETFLSHLPIHVGPLCCGWINQPCRLGKNTKSINLMDVGSTYQTDLEVCYFHLIFSDFRAILPVMVTSSSFCLSWVDRMASYFFQVIVQFSWKALILFSFWNIKKFLIVFMFWNSLNKFRNFVWFTTFCRWRQRITSCHHLFLFTIT